MSAATEAESGVEDMIAGGENGRGNDDSGLVPPAPVPAHARFDFMEAGTRLLRAAIDGVESPNGVYDAPLPTEDDAGRTVPRILDGQAPAFASCVGTVRRIGIDAVFIRGFIDWTGVRAALGQGMLIVGTDSQFLNQDVSPDSFFSDLSKNKADKSNGGERVVMIATSVSTIVTIPHRLSGEFFAAAGKAGLLDVVRQQLSVGFPDKKNARSGNMLQLGGGKGQPCSSQNLALVLEAMAGLTPAGVSVKSWGQMMPVPVALGKPSPGSPFGVDNEATRALLDAVKGCK
jgi:hypothetical protein